MNIKTFASIIVTFLVLGFGGCTCEKVPAGHVGIKVYLLGSQKGVDHEELGVGRYVFGINEELYLYPTFKQNYTWTKSSTEGSRNDESINFQTREGLPVSADVGITYRIKPDSVSKVFQSYRRGVEEITDTFLRNVVRNAFVQVSSEMPVEAVYGKGKSDMLARVKEQVRSEMAPLGIVVEDIYLVGEVRVPKNVSASLNAKVEATQRAQQRENELREAQAAAKKKVAEAQGEAEGILVKAQARAKSNKLMAESITPELVEYERIKKWDGKLPTVTSGGLQMFNMSSTLK